MNYADNNSLTCDSVGNCMLKDNLGNFKEMLKSHRKARLADDDVVDELISDKLVNAALIPTILMIPAAMVPIMRGLTHDDVVDDLRIFDGKWIKKVKDSIVVTKTTFNPATGKYDDPKTRVQSVPMMMVTDELISIGGRVGKFSGSVKFDDDLVDDLNFLTCNDVGNCTLKDRAVQAGVIGSIAMIPVAEFAMVNSIGRDDDDDDLVDNLGKFSVGLGKAKIGFGWADNSLTCDSEGNCMLKDELRKCLKMGPSPKPLASNVLSGSDLLSTISEHLPCIK